MRRPGGLLLAALLHWRGLVATNPAGALVDGLTYANGRLNTDWDAIWRVRTTRTARGWTAEFAIPFKSLNFPKGRGVWALTSRATSWPRPSPT